MGCSQKVFIFLIFIFHSQPYTIDFTDPTQPDWFSKNWTPPPDNYHEPSLWTLWWWWLIMVLIMLLCVCAPIIIVVCCVCGVGFCAGMGGANASCDCNRCPCGGGKKRKGKTGSYPKVVEAVDAAVQAEVPEPAPRDERTRLRMCKRA